MAELRRPPTARVAALALALTASGCGGCDEERSVPFKRDEPAPTHADAGKGGADAGTDGGTFEPRHGSSHAEGTRRIELGGSVLEVETGALRASLEADLDADGDLDALLVTTSDEGAAALARAERGPEGLSAIEVVARLGEVAQDCTLESVVLEAFAPRFVAARAEVRCRLTVSAEAAAAASPTAPTPAPPANAGSDAKPPTSTRRLWIVTLEALPRVGVALGWSNPLVGSTDGVAFGEATLARSDLDADGHEDVAVSIALSEPGAEAPSALVLRFLDRPAGLARDASEPEAAWLERANAARLALRKDAPRALAEAERLLALHAAVCSESAHARLSLGETHGLACGRSRAAGRAAAVRIAALAKTGRVLDAIERLGALDDRAYDVLDADRERAREAVAAFAATEPGWQAGPAFAPPTRPALRLGALGFLDEETLLLRGPTARTYRVGGSEPEPVGIPGDVLAVDPTGAFAAVDLFRSCEGYRVRIVRATQVVAGIVGGESVSEPLVEGAEPPSGARCPEALPSTLRRDSGGWRLLDWTAAGLVFSRGASLARLALDAEAKAQAPAALLASGDAVPVPHAGALDESGRHLAVATALGIAVIERTTGMTALLPYRGSLEGAAASSVSDVAVSPSGRRVAVLHGGRIHVASHAVGAGAAPAPSAAPATAPQNVPADVPAAPAPAVDPTLLPPPAP